jgi:hypothetical protein
MRDHPGVIKFTTPFEKLKEYSFSAEVRLYKAIIVQAITDASNTNHNPKSRKYELEAKRWIFGDSDDLHDICLNAQLNVKYMQKIARKTIFYNKTLRGACQPANDI